MDAIVFISLILLVPGVVLLFTRWSPRPGSVKTTGLSKTTALSLIGFMVGLTVACFLFIAANYAPHLKEFYIPSSMCAVAIIGQIIYIVDIKKNWESMSPTERQKKTAQGVFLPPLVAMGSFLAIAIGLIALAIWMFTVSGGSSGSENSGSGPRYRDFKDRYGNRLGSLDAQTGEIKNRYGNRAGSISPNTGEIKDRYGNRTGWIE